MYEYKVIDAPAPSRGGWFGKGQTFADTLTDAINELALEHWEFQRAEAGARKNERVLVFRKLVQKADSKMDAPKAFADRLLENEAHAQEAEAGREYAGPVRPRRAKVILDQSGTMTERPQTLEPDMIEIKATPVEGAVAPRITPMKPRSASPANA